MISTVDVHSPMSRVVPQRTHVGGALPTNTPSGNTQGPVSVSPRFS